MEAAVLSISHEAKSGKVAQRRGDQRYDMKRMDSYPQVVESKRISPWFRVNLVDTYERGIMAPMGGTDHARAGVACTCCRAAAAVRGIILTLLISRKSRASSASVLRFFCSRSSSHLRQV
jgi:hypothetical protein